MRGRVFIGAAAVAVAWAAPAAASTAKADGCDEQQAFVAGDSAAVAKRLPEGYAPVRTDAGDPLLFVRAIRCDAMTFRGWTGPAVMGSYGVVIDSPDGAGCASAVSGPAPGDFPPICNWYTLRWVATERPIVRWLKGGARGFPVQRIRALKFELGAFDPAQLGTPFHFAAPAFGIDAVTRPRPGALQIRGGYWFGPRTGALKVTFASDDLTSGDANGTVTARQGSRLARLIGSHDGSYLPAYSGFTAEHWDHATYTR